MCTYGIELLADNIAECRANMLEILADYLNLEESEDSIEPPPMCCRRTRPRRRFNERTSQDQPITFPEWVISARASSAS